jgi:hypothetical protein
LIINDSRRRSIFGAGTASAKRRIPAGEQRSV